MKLENNIPEVGYGTWKIKNDATPEVVITAIKCGYRHIDAAKAYGNEKEVGEGIKASGINRSELLITNKLWNDSRDFDKAIGACKESLFNMNLEYFDEYLIHWPASMAVHENWEEINIDAWKGLEELHKLGLVKKIGVCNFKKHHLESLMSNCTIKPMINQIEMHPGYYQKETIEYCNENNIKVEAWSPIGSGKLDKKQVLSDMALKYNVSIAQLCIRWCLEHGATPLPRSSNFDRMKENLDVYGFSIGEEDMNIIDKLERTSFSGLDPDTITIFG